MTLSNGTIYPTAPAGATVTNLPDDVKRAWQEVRTAHAVAAYTASEVMSRKILMHVAVDQSLAKSGESFVCYVDALDKAGYITTGLKPVIDRIRDRGNRANHDLSASTEEDSFTTLLITEHLLKAMYELPALGGVQHDA